MGKTINPKSSFIMRRGTAFPKGKAVALLFACFFIMLILSGCGEDRALVLSLSGAGEEALGSADAAGSLSGAGEEAQPKEIFVHVCGAVMDPGLKGLPEGSRVADALALAGGFAEDADPSYVNLAAFLEDGQQLYFPTKEESLLEEKPSKVNVNTADEEKLMTLPGIGQSRAAAILKYRKEHGVFAKAEDLKSVPGISETTWEQIKDLITVR